MAGTRSARSMRAAVIDAASAATAQDGELFADACQRLAAVDQQRLRLVQGTMVRELLEELHPDGLTGPAAQDVLERCVQAAGSWYADLDPAVLVVVMLGALGVHSQDEPPAQDHDPDGHAPDEQPAPTPAAVAAHATLLVVELCGPAEPGQDQPARLAGLVDRAFAEIARAETIELP